MLKTPPAELSSIVRGARPVHVTSRVLLQASMASAMAPGSLQVVHRAPQCPQVEPGNNGIRPKAACQQIELLTADLTSPTVPRNFHGSPIWAISVQWVRPFDHGRPTTVPAKIAGAAVAAWLQKQSCQPAINRQGPKLAWPEDRPQKLRRLRR